MTLQPFFDVLCRTDVIGAILYALKYVNEVRHEGFLWLESLPVNEKSLSQKDRLFYTVAGTTRLELATSGVTGRRSNQN